VIRKTPRSEEITWTQHFHNSLFARVRRYGKSHKTFPQIEDGLRWVTLIKNNLVLLEVDVLFHHVRRIENILYSNGHAIDLGTQFIAIDTRHGTLTWNL
jgi:hypothetical protein